MYKLYITSLSIIICSFCNIVFGRGGATKRIVYRIRLCKFTALRRGFKERRTGRTPPPLKFSKIRVLIYIMTNAHIFRSIFKSQLFTCLSLAILFLSCTLCSVTLIFSGDLITTQKVQKFLSKPSTKFDRVI